MFDEDKKSASVDVLTEQACRSAQNFRSLCPVVHSMRTRYLKNLLSNVWQPFFILSSFSALSKAVLYWYATSAETSFVITAPPVPSQVVATHTAPFSTTQAAQLAPATSPAQATSDLPTRASIRRVPAGSANNGTFGAKPKPPLPRKTVPSPKGQMTPTKGKASGAKGPSRGGLLKGSDQEKLSGNKKPASESKFNHWRTYLNPEFDIDEGV